MYAKKIKGFRNFYIHKDGYVFKAIGHKEIIIPTRVVKTVPKVLLGGKNYNVAFLMLEYFGEKIIKPYGGDMSQIRIKYRIIDGKIPMHTIKIVEYCSNKHEDLRKFKFKCLEKANSANSRVNNISTISDNDVFDSLIRTDFKCSYCNRKLDFRTWELDHVSPLSKSGLNIPNNISPACKNCNRMKSNLDIVEFIHTCKMISLNFEDSEYLTGETFKQKQESWLDRNEKQ